METYKKHIIGSPLVQWGRNLNGHDRYGRCSEPRDRCEADLQVAESGRLRPSGAAGASFFGGAVWGNFRENANCGDPPG